MVYWSFVYLLSFFVILKKIKYLLFVLIKKAHQLIRRKGSNLKKITKIVLVVTLVVLALVFSPLTFSRSNEPCQRCHGSSYYQYLDILEGDSGNQIPSTLAVGQTVTVKVVVSNDVNTATYSTLSVSLTLSSANGHFTVDHPTYSISSMPAGTATATWQITGTSDGYDYLVIQATGINSHFSSFSDSYSSPPLIRVGQPTGTPEPIQTPTTPASTPTPTQSTSTPAPTQTTAPTNTTSNQPTASPTPTQTTSTTQTPTTTDETEASDWSTTAIVTGLIVGILVVIGFLVYKLRAKKTK